MQLTIYVPRSGGVVEKTVAPRSAIVADPARETDGLLLCYYEGNVRGAADSDSFFAKLLHAADRLVLRYPTAAMQGFPVDDLEPVGTYDGERKIVLAITNPDALRGWSGEAAEAILGVRLPTGSADWRAAAPLAQSPHARPIGHQSAEMTEAWYKTQAGQILRFDLGARGVEVFEHDDPALPNRLAHLHLDAADLRRALGQAAGTAPRAP